jgi:3'-phosphoadenosine 5'-phosphosulfate sulfotransferase (PAPS reductase)/FAD synthetase
VKAHDNVTIFRPKKTFKQIIEKFGYPVISKEVSTLVYDARNAIRKRGGGGYALARLNSENSYNNVGKWSFLLEAPFKISSNCCDVMKKAPAKRYEKESKRCQITATMASESNLRRTAWLRDGCNAFNAQRPTSKPMSFWTEQDVLQYIKRYNIPIAEPYGDIVEENGKLTTTGLNRTGCMFCLFGIQHDKSPNRLERLKEAHPKMYEYVMKPESEGGLGYKDKIDWLNEHGNLHIKY